MLTGPLSNNDNFFIVTDTYLRNLYQVDATSGATAQLLPFGVASNPVALAYDSSAKLIYWTDVHLHTINRYSLLTNSSSVIYRDPSNTGKYIRLIYTKFVGHSHLIFTCIRRSLVCDKCIRHSDTEYRQRCRK